MIPYRSLARARALVIGLALAAMAIVAAPVHAQDDAQRDQARRHFRAGKAAFNDGQYLAAARAFEESYKILSLPEIAFSMAQAYRLQYFVDKQPHGLKRAIDLYQVYVAQKPKGNRFGVAITHLAELQPILLRMQQEGMSFNAAVQETQVMINSQIPGAMGRYKDQYAKLPLTLDLEPGGYEVEISAEGYFTEKHQIQAVKNRFITVEVDLKAKPAQLSVQGVAGADITIDGRPEGETPLVRPLEVAEGSHFVAVTKRGHRPWSLQVDLARGQELTLEPKLRITTQRKVAYGFGAFALAAALGGTVTSLAAARENRAAQDILTRRNTESITADDLIDYNIHRDERNRLLGGSVAAFSVAGLALVTGGLLYYLDTPRAERPPAAPRREQAPPAVAPTDDGPELTSVVPMVGRDNAGIAVLGRF